MCQRQSLTEAAAASLWELRSEVSTLLRFSFGGILDPSTALQEEILALQIDPTRSSGAVCQVLKVENLIGSAESVVRLGF